MSRDYQGPFEVAEMFSSEIVRAARWLDPVTVPGYVEGLWKR